MPDSPASDRGPRRRDKPEGVVPFDPAPPPPLEPVEQRSSGRGPVVGLAALVVLLVGYIVFQQLGGTTEQPPLPGPAAAPPLGADALAAAGGGRLEGQTGSSVAIEVHATGRDGRPLADTVVSFRVVQGGGRLEREAARTDAAGIARTVLLLPRRVGSVLVGAEVPGTAASATLTVEALAGVPAEMRILGGDGQTADAGEVLPVENTVLLVDDDGNPVPGAEVRFEVVSGGGISTGRYARTDSLGQVSALWRLGPELGTQELRAVSPTLGRTVTFRATARDRLAAGDSSLPAEPGAVATAPGAAPVIPPVGGPVSVVRRELVVGASHVCRLVQGSTACRGANDSGQRGSQPFAGFVSLASGIAHVCGLDAAGVAMCWGANDGGQLGDGSRTDRPSPVPVRTEQRFASLTAGQTHTCGIAGGGSALCWGQNLSGQIGDGTRNDARFPLAVSSGMTFAILVAGWSHTCGLTPNGTAFCWGLNGDGQLGDASRLDRLLPALVRGSFESLAAGSAHTCGISQGRVLCWGDNRFGQLGDGTNEGRTQPTPVASLPTRPTAVVAGAVHSCALLGDGAAYCWGQNLHGQLGDGTTENRSVPTAVTGPVRFRALQAGGALTCGLTLSGSEYCWGLNQSGQLGDGTRQNRSTPTEVQR